MVVTQTRRDGGELNQDGKDKVTRKEKEEMQLPWQAAPGRLEGDH